MFKKSADRITYPEIESHFTQLDDPSDGKHLDWPYKGYYFFEITGKLVGKQHSLRKGTEGRWHSFIPSAAAFLDEQAQTGRATHFVTLGTGGYIGELAFEANSAPDTKVAIGGLLKYLNGDYSPAETEKLQARTQQLYIANQKGLEHSLNHALDTILHDGHFQ